MKLIGIPILLLGFNFQAVARDWEQTVIIDEAVCTYDQYGYPKIRVVISPAVTIESKPISIFTNAHTYGMCPNMSEIADRLYVNVKLKTEKDSFSYQLDKNEICNRYETTTFFMFIPIHRSAGRSYLAMLAPIKNTLKERNVSIGHCTDGY